MNLRKPKVGAFNEGLSLADQLMELRRVTEGILTRETDPELRLKAVDRRHKQIELEARLAGEFKQDAPNPLTRDEAFYRLAAEKLLARLKAKGKAVTPDEAYDMIKSRRPQAEVVH
jgi:hypothetical protein